MDYPSRSPDAEILFELLPSAFGGRKKATLSGYTPLYDIQHHCWASAIHQFLDTEKLAPGQSTKAHIWFITPDAYPHTLWLRRTLRAREGTQIIAIATVLQIFNPHLLRDGAPPE